jgi:hypothetical protein
VTGQVITSGNAVAIGAGAQANATGAATYSALGLGWRFGWLAWRPTLLTQVSGSASAANRIRTRDPISYEILGPGGIVSETGDLLTIDMDFLGDSALQWNGTTLNVAPNANAILDIHVGDRNNAVANYVPDTMEGHLRLRLDNGLVAEATKTGAGAWLADWILPAVGTQFSGNIPTSNGLDFGWDFGQPVDANIVMFTQGPMSPIPEPGEWAGLAAAGLLGFAVLRRRARARASS